MTTNKLTKQIARKVLQTVDAGLVCGKGVPEPGKMCVEAAVCFSLGLPHSDQPPCVGEAVRSFKINLNDAPWSSDEARTKGMRKLSIAQLGSDTIDQQAFSDLVCLKGVNKILSAIFRTLAKHPESKNPEKELAIAKQCEEAKTTEEAKKAAKDASASASASAYASAYASASASASASAYASAYASASASASAYASAYFKKELGEDYFLTAVAAAGLEALVELKSPGAEWLDLCEEEPATK